MKVSHYNNFATCVVSGQFFRYQYGTPDVAVRYSKDINFSKFMYLLHESGSATNTSGLVFLQQNNYVLVLPCWFLSYLANYTVRVTCKNVALSIVTSSIYSLT